MKPKELETLYDEYLQEVGEKEYEEKYGKIEESDTTWFNVSKAGSCMFQHVRKVSGKIEKVFKTNPKSRRNMRLGTLAHNDLQEAIKSKLKSDDTVITMIEEKTESKKFNTRGPLDFGRLYIAEKTAFFYDFKTIGSYPYTKKFGLLKNREKNPSLSHEYQITTYALSKEEELGIVIEKLYILYIKKDDGTWKSIEFPLSKYREEVIKYWEDVNKLKEELKDEDLNEIDPLLLPSSPTQEWECKYCSYSKGCLSPFRKE